MRRVQRGCSARLQSVCCDNTARVQNCARCTCRVGAHLRALELLVRVVIGHGLGLWCADEQRRAEGRLHGVDEQRWHLVRAQRMRSVHTQSRCRRSMHSACSVCSARGVTGQRRRRGSAAPRAGRAWPRRSSSRRRRRAAATREGAGGGAARAGGGPRGQQRASAARGALSLQVRSCNPRKASCTCSAGKSWRCGDLQEPGRTRS